MLEKLAKQTAVYGISTIAVRFLSYLLTPYYTRIFGQETYGIVTDIYALIPLALTLLTMGMESSYFRFSAKAEEAGGDVKAAKRRLFATTWGVTSLAAAVFFVVVAFFRDGISHLMGEAYVALSPIVGLLGSSSCSTSGHASPSHGCASRDGRCCSSDSRRWASCSMSSWLWHSASPGFFPPGSAWGGSSSPTLSPVP